MQKTTIMRVLRYTIAGIVGYFGTKYFFPTKEDKEKREIKRLPKVPGIIQDPLNPVDIRGGFGPRDNFFEKFFSNDRKYLLGAISAISLLMVGDRYKVVVGEILTEASPAIAALPVPLIKDLLNGLATLDAKELLKILRTGLTSNELSVEEKLSLVKKTFVGLVLSARAAGWQQKLLFSTLLGVLAIIAANGSLLAGGMVVFQDLFTRIGFKRATAEFIVDIYREYNAPIPKELYDLLTSVGSKVVSAT